MPRSYTLTEIDALRKIAWKQLVEEGATSLSGGGYASSIEEATQLMLQRAAQTTMLEERVRTLMTGGVEP